MIEETLVLSTGQQSKICSANSLHGPVLVYQLEFIKKHDLINNVKEKLLSMTKSANASVFIYSSMECLMKKPWNFLMVKLINNGVLKLVCVDEMHIFAMFGIIFRKEFFNLKDLFLNTW